MPTERPRPPVPTGSRRGTLALPGRPLRRPLLGLGVALLALLLAEGVLRLVVPGEEVSPDGSTMPISPLLGWEPVPGPSRQFGVPQETYINRHGTRNPEPGPKPSGALRLVTLGDSSVYGVFVRDDEVFSAVAARRLAERLGRPVEGWNGGYPGYSSEQSTRLYRWRLRELDPDVLVVANLWSDTQFGDVPDRRKYFGAVGRALPFLSRVALFRGLALLVREDPRAAGSRKVTWKIAPTDPESTRVPLSMYRENLRGLARLAGRDGARPVFLLLPCDRDLRGEPLEPPRPAFRDAMREVAAAEGAVLVDGFTPLVRHGGNLLVDDVHPNAEGHRLIGEALADALQPVLAAP